MNFHEERKIFDKIEKETCKKWKISIFIETSSIIRFEKIDGNLTKQSVKNLCKTLTDSKF